MARDKKPPETATMRVLRYCFPTFVRFYFWLQERLTLGGAAILIAMLVCTPAILQTEPSLVHLFSALAAMLIVTAVLSYWLRPRLLVKSKMTARCMCGDIFNVEIWLTNISSWAAYELQVDLLETPLSWEICDGWPSFDTLSPGETIRCTLKIRANKRGYFKMPALRVITTFPLHLIRRRVMFEPVGEISVYPRFADHGAITLTDFSHGVAGMERENSQLARGSSEYLGNREYQPGLPVRRWDYASWARLGRPIVREYLDVQPSSASIIVDTSHDWPQSFTEVPSVEAALAIAARVANSLVSLGWSVDTLVLGSQMFQASNQASTLSLETLLDALASVEPLEDRQFSEFSELVELYAQNQSTTFIIFNQWDARRRQLCDSLHAMGIECRGWIITADHQPVDARGTTSQLVQIALSELISTRPITSEIAKGANR